jgi:hypothetical protein
LQLRFSLGPNHLVNCTVHSVNNKVFGNFFVTKSKSFFEKML